MNSFLANCIQVVNDSFPSIYTKDDVIKLLMSFDVIVPETKTIVTRVISEEVLEDLVERIVSQLEQEGADLVDGDSAEFYVSVDHNLKLEIDITDIELNTSALQNAVEKAIMKWQEENEIETEEEDQTVAEPAKSSDL